MSRSRNKVPAKARHKKILNAAKGYRGARSKQFRTANAAVRQA
ncbi:MAG: 50S ribosomal protein L20, partial [Pseudomonadota bacterium]